MEFLKKEYNLRKTSKLYKNIKSIYVNIVAFIATFSITYKLPPSIMDLCKVMPILPRQSIALLQKIPKGYNSLVQLFLSKKNIKKQPKTCKHSFPQILASFLLKNLQAHLTSPSNSHTSNHTHWWEKENPHKGFHPLL